MFSFGEAKFQFNVILFLSDNHYHYLVEQVGLIHYSHPSVVLTLTAAVAEWVRAWDTLPMFEATCAEGRKFDPRPGQYSRMSFSSDQVTGTVSSSEHAFPSKF